MFSQTPQDDLWKSGIAFWCGLWQAQMETGLRVWSAWAQVVPHESARALAAEADALKAPTVAKTAAKSPVRKPAPRRRTKPATP